MTHPAHESNALCPGCRQPLVPGRAQGLCPRCLLAQAMLTGGPDGSPSPATAPDLASVSAAFPQLEILGLIGRGGMGVVYKARQRSLDRIVALKLLAPERVTDPGFAERFEREARALAQLNHPNIVTIHDHGIACPAGADGAEPPPFYFLLMEFVDGVNLRQAIEAGRFSPEQALAIVPPVCEALQFAHERGIVHRDIKPENLLLDRAGRVKIVDFGIARMLGDGPRPHDGTGPDAAASPAHGSPGSATLHTAAGTPEYMAPEQRDPATRADHRADIYSLGVVLYELLTGELPGSRMVPPSTKVQVDVRLDAVVLRALSVQPELRYATAAEFLSVLNTVNGTGTGPANVDQSGSAGSGEPKQPMKSSAGFLYREGEWDTLEGQFCAWRRRGQLLLDGQQLVHTKGSRQTLIPLRSVRDVSIGSLPQSLNPAGLDVLWVTYEENAKLHRVAILPARGWFALPGTWRNDVAEWAAAVREGVRRATGHAPAETPREALPQITQRPLLTLLVPLLAALPGMAMFVFLAMHRNPPGPDNLLQFSLLLAALPVATYAATRVIFSYLNDRRMGTRLGGIGGASIVLACLFAAVLWGLRQRPQTPPAATITLTPVALDGSLVVVELDARITGGSMEFRTGLDGPELPTEVLSELAGRPTGERQAMVRSGVPSGSRPWQILAVGSYTWRLTFVFPGVAPAAETFRGLTRREVHGVAGDTLELFDTIASDGVRYTGKLAMSMPLTSATPSWVSIEATTRNTPSMVTVNWTVLTQRPAEVGVGKARALLSPAPGGGFRLGEGQLGVELHRLDADRIRINIRRPGVTSVEEVDGSFREVADELLASVRLSSKGALGEEFELCRYLSRSIQLRVAPASTSPASDSAAKGPEASP